MMSRDDRIAEEVECPECGSDRPVRDDRRGEVVCDGCGLVLGERVIDAGPEWRAYSVEEENTLARTGPPRDVLLGTSGMMTVLPHATKDARGRAISHEHRGTFRRLRKLQYTSGRRSGRDRNGPYVAGLVARAAFRLGVPPCVEEEARFLCRAALDRRITRGRSMGHVVAAAIYAACRVAGVPRTLEELEGATGLPKTSIGRTYRVLRGVAGVRPVPLPRASDYVDRFCSELSLSSPVRAEALRIVRDFEESGTGNALSPAGIAAGAICAAATSLGEARTQRAIAEVAGVSAVTIRNRLRDLERVAIRSARSPGRMA